MAPSVQKLLRNYSNLVQLQLPQAMSQLLCRPIALDILPILKGLIALVVLTGDELFYRNDSESDRGSNLEQISSTKSS